MCAAPYSSPPGYYSQPYHYYYNSTAQYCAYDSTTGNHYIYNSEDMQWYSYVQYGYTKGNGYNPPEYHYPRGSYGKGGFSCGYDGGHVKSGEGGWEYACRSHGEEFRHSTGAAPRNPIEENNVEMGTYFEDEGVDVNIGERSGRSRRYSNERQRQRSRSGLTRKDDTTYRGASSSRHRVYHHDQHQHIRKQEPEQTFGSNQAGVGCEGSDHDSGYMGDFDPVPEPRRSMPGVAKWLDNTPDEFSGGGGGRHPLDMEYDCDSRPQPTKKNGVIPNDLLMDKSGRDRSRSSSYRYRIESQWNQRSYDNQVGVQGDGHKVFSSRALHHQDSGIDIQMEITSENEAPNTLHFAPHDSPPKQWPSHPRSSTPAHLRREKAWEVYEYCYTIPPCPNLPPPVEAPAEAPEAPSGVVYRLGSQELTAPRYRNHPPPMSPTFCQPDSVCTGSVIESRQNHYHYDDYICPPKAPSPPPTPVPHFAHRGRRSVPGFPR